LKELVRASQSRLVAFVTTTTTTTSGAHRLGKHVADGILEALGAVLLQRWRLCVLERREVS
jgi:hypothetical protein